MHQVKFAEGSFKKIEMIWSAKASWTNWQEPTSDLWEFNNEILEGTILHFFLPFQSSQKIFNPKTFVNNFQSNQKNLALVGTTYKTFMQTETDSKPSQASKI